MNQFDGGGDMEPFSLPAQVSVRSSPITKRCDKQLERGQEIKSVIRPFLLRKNERSSGSISSSSLLVWCRGR